MSRRKIFYGFKTTKLLISTFSKINLVLTLTWQKMIATNSSLRNLRFTPLVSVNSFNSIWSPSGFKGCFSFRYFVKRNTTTFNPSLWTTNNTATLWHFKTLWILLCWSLMNITFCLKRMEYHFKLNSRMLFRFFASQNARACCLQFSMTRHGKPSIVLWNRTKSYAMWYEHGLI